MLAPGREASECVQNGNTRRVSSGLKPRRSGDAIEEVGTRVFVGQVPEALDVDNIRRHFEPYGKVLTVSIIRNKIGQHRGNSTQNQRSDNLIKNMVSPSTGCAFVVFEDRDAAQQCVEQAHDKLVLPEVCVPRWHEGLGLM
eukprot:c54591_g1_i1.p1 GENE.c54591_g1_i1~~c54591_g1_i1.p1  ORF type:complete len:141 (+),score=18.08 c54591_g1_i1:236-658(+)